MNLNEVQLSQRQIIYTHKTTKQKEKKFIKQSTSIIMLNFTFFLPKKEVFEKDNEKFNEFYFWSNEKFAIACWCFYNFDGKMNKKSKNSLFPLRKPLNDRGWAIKHALCVYLFNSSKSIKYFFKIKHFCFLLLWKFTWTIDKFIVSSITTVICRIMSWNLIQWTEKKLCGNLIWNQVFRSKHCSVLFIIVRFHYEANFQWIWMTNAQLFCYFSKLIITCSEKNH